MTQNTMEEKWKDRFNKEFTVSHPGDSGIGGNEPQEPVYQICVDDPKEFISFITSEKQISYQEGFKKAMGEVNCPMKGRMCQCSDAGICIHIPKCICNNSSTGGYCPVHNGTLSHPRNY